MSQGRIKRHLIAKALFPGNIISINFKLFLLMQKTKQKTQRALKEECQIRNYPETGTIEGKGLLLVLKQ